MFPGHMHSPSSPTEAVCPSTGDCASPVPPLSSDGSLTALPRPIMVLSPFLHYLTHSLGSHCGVHIGWNKRSAEQVHDLAQLSGQDILQLLHPLFHLLYNLNSMDLPKGRQITALIPSPPGRLQMLL